MTLRDAIALAIERAVERRGCWDVQVGRGDHRWAEITAAVDGSLQLAMYPDFFVRRWLMRSRRELEPAAMRSLGFETYEFGWLKPIRAYGGADREAAATLERVFVEQLDASLDDDASVDESYPGVLPDRPAPPPDASHAEHIRASLELFDIDPEADVCIHAGLPSAMYLQLALDADGRVVMIVTQRDDERPEIPGFAPDDELAWAVHATFDIAEIPAVAAEVLHDHLSIDPVEPLFVELGSEELPYESIPA